ncbi:exported hypothetical protein [Xanthomonas phaseoli pv. phaseoli]|uniref:Secreted protein n=1 Tax=Xanthomonas campestris pv. phaseoli TaxID=317013 RepID=A0AB38E411_XANCH|nr:exported hypothetical protein [Xanthomonas phaseoli pv. phaseoli]SON86954.1 exported hypothetical protein [Xanthomonas phaseoli pv. phaseoli]SON90965.1 exported hypothetical protein [Xanthomonas phaseoli pv. phaseoli]
MQKRCHRAWQRHRMQRPLAAIRRWLYRALVTGLLCAATLAALRAAGQESTSKQGDRNGGCSLGAGKSTQRLQTEFCFNLAHCRRRGQIALANRGCSAFG